MRPQAVDHTEFAIRDQLLLGLAVVRREKHIARERHDIGPRLDAAERCGKIATRMAADITMPPFPAHPDQVIRVHRREIGLPKPVQEVLQRSEADVAPRLLLIEILAEAHYRPDLRVPP